MPPASKPHGHSWKTGAILALRVAPWVVFGPITGFFANKAATAFLKGRLGVAVLMVVLNVLIVASIPALTVAVLSLQANAGLGGGAYGQADSPVS